MIPSRLALSALIATAFQTVPTHAATIYLCKAYNGSTFWSQAHCREHRALIDRIESVADVPWSQQVEQAEQRKRGTPSAPDTTGSIRCQQLYAELRHIEKRYEAGYWQDVPTVNRDQSRTRALRADLSSSGCSMR